MIRSVIPITLITVVFFWLYSTDSAADDVQELNDCALVPGVQWKSAAEFSAIGLLSRTAVKIHWAFFDANGQRLASGSEPSDGFASTVDSNSVTQFIWSAATPGAGALQNRLGTLLFCQDANTDDIISAEPGTLAGNAFFVDLNASDVFVLPVLGASAEGLASANPASWNSDPVTVESLDSDADSTEAVDIKYLIDGISGPDSRIDTQIYIYSTADLNVNQSARLYNNTGDSRAILFNVDSRLAVIDPETVNVLGSLPASFNDGFLRWVVPGNALPDPSFQEVFIFAVIRAVDFGAVQTVWGISP